VFLNSGALASNHTLVPHLFTGLMAPTNSSSVATSSNDANSNRNSTLQILADGSLDLTALIALFATDSVERYALDYMQGFVAAAAPLSLFGILDYVKTLLKLSIDPEFCERMGFGTEGIKPYFGLGPSERAIVTPSDLVELVYLERLRNPDAIGEPLYIWTPQKSLWHTLFSMALVKGDSWQRNLDPFHAGEEPHGLVLCKPNMCRKALYTAVFTTLLMTSLSSSLSGLLLCPMISIWTWSSYYAVFGIMISITLGSLPWLLIFVFEQVPSDIPPYFPKDWDPWSRRSILPEDARLDQKPSATASK
jgi:hypothetical protein